MKASMQALFLSASIIGYSALLLSCSSEESEVVLWIKGTPVTVELAVTEEQHRTGLMYREELANNHGMLFVFESDRRLSFWMKNTSIPLSIAYIDKDGVIKEIYDMEPYSLQSVPSTYSVRYALEVDQGFFEKIGATTGDAIVFPDGFPESYTRE